MYWRKYFLSNATFLRSDECKIFINNLFGGFTVSAQANIIQKGWGSATWFDVDADGNLDLLLNGDGGADGEASSDVYRLYKNNNYRLYICIIQ